MKIIFFLGTVDIFWVMESWVMKKLLGPNGRAKTQFSQIIMLHFSNYEDVYD